MRIPATLFALAVLATIGVPAPAFAQSAEAPALDISQWRGNVVLLDFWASWCAPCQQSFPWMARMREKYGERGLVVVAVNVDEDESAAARFLADGKGDFVYVKDPEGRIATAYGLAVMPSSWIFDREGRPLYRHEGFRQDETGEYESHIVELLENRGSKGVLTIGAAAPIGLGVHPWERDVLADPVMQLICDPLETELDDHIYFSKEASSGGRGFGGGGCGCN